MCLFLIRASGYQDRPGEMQEKGWKRCQTWLANISSHKQLQHDDFMMQRLQRLQVMTVLECGTPVPASLVYCCACERLPCSISQLEGTCEKARKGDADSVLFEASKVRLFKIALTASDFALNPVLRIRLNHPLTPLHPKVANNLMKQYRTCPAGLWMSEQKGWLVLPLTWIA